MSLAKISIISAVGRNREIGKNNTLLWNLPEDLKHFKEKTSGHPVIMGQKTYESIGRALPDRTNIILSKEPNLKIDGCIVCDSIDEAIREARKHDDAEIFIIGGGSIYAQTIGLADKLYLTLVDADYDADTFFPDYAEFDQIVSESETFNCNGLKYRFIELGK